MRCNNCHIYAEKGRLNLYKYFLCKNYHKANQQSNRLRIRNSFNGSNQKKDQNLIEQSKQEQMSERKEKCRLSGARMQLKGKRKRK